MARIWFHQNVGGAFDPVTGARIRTRATRIGVCQGIRSAWNRRCSSTSGSTTSRASRTSTTSDSIILLETGQSNFRVRTAGRGRLPRRRCSQPHGGVGTSPSRSGVRRHRTNPAKTVSFRERLMAEAQLVNLNESPNTAGFNLQLSAAPGGGRGGSCFGDSGGPIFYGGLSSDMIVGVTSWLFGFNRQTCGGPGFAFRTDTEAVIEWILGIVEQYHPASWMRSSSSKRPNLHASYDERAPRPGEPGVASPSKTASRKSAGTVARKTRQSRGRAAPCPRARRARSLLEARPTPESVPVARDELAVMAIDMRQRAEAVELHIVQPIGVIKGLRNAEQAHRPQGTRIQHASHLEDTY